MIDKDFERASHLCICEICGKLYIEHELYKEILSYDDKPFLRVLCDGRLVKL